MILKNLVTRQNLNKEWLLVILVSSAKGSQFVAWLWHWTYLIISIHYHPEAQDQQ